MIFVEHFEPKFVNTNNIFAFTICSISENIIGPSFMLNILTTKLIKKETKGIVGILDQLKH